MIALFASLIVGVTCPRTMLTDGTEFDVIVMAHHVRMVALLYDDSSNEIVDARYCGPGQRVEFHVSRGTYSATAKLVKTQVESERSDSVTKGYKSPCGVCHDR